MLLVTTFCSSCVFLHCVNTTGPIMGPSTCGYLQLITFMFRWPVGVDTVSYTHLTLPTNREV